MSRLVPKLRFEEFSGEWEEKRLEEISKKISYGLTIRPEYIDFGIPLISAKELRDGNINYEVSSKISQESYNVLSEKAKAKRGDIFLSKTGTIGLCGYVDVDFPIAITQNIAIIRVDNKVYSHSFILQIFKTTIFYKMALAKVNQSTIMDLQLQDIRKLSILIPSIKEQQKIASCLSSLDSLIEAQKSKVEALKKHKKGLMQGLFPKEGEKVPTLRFDGFSGEWEEKRLEEISNITTGSSNREDSTKDNGKYTFFDRSEDIRTSSKYLFDDEAIIIAGEGQKFTPKYYKGKFDLHQRTYAILELQIIGEFLYYYTDKHKDYFLQNAVGSTVKSLRLPMFQQMPILLPTLPEQQKIASCLSSLAALIEANNQKVEALKKHKKGLMQQMFVSGEE